MIALQDTHQRKFETLRVSLIEHCNFQCSYCTMASDQENLYEDHRPQQSVDFFIRKIDVLHQQLRLKTIRLTGGEPLLYQNITPLIAKIKSLGIADIRLTTNGFLLSQKAAALQKAGLKSVNVSLDAMNETTFQQLTGRHKLKQVLNGISGALKNGLSVKLNAVILKGKNEDQILPLLEFAFQNNIPVRFLELMNMGYLYQKQSELLYSQKEILNLISQRYTLHRVIRRKSATANYWQTNEGHKFGIIANESKPFCADCNRLRLDSKGNLYGCLSSNFPLPFDENSADHQIHQVLQQAMDQKQNEKFTGSALSMLNIGG